MTFFRLASGLANLRWPLVVTPHQRHDCLTESGKPQRSERDPLRGFVFSAVSGGTP
jgi:hypothetical protein